MSNRPSPPPQLIILAGLVLALPATLIFWWWAENQEDETEVVDETMVKREGVSLLAPTPKWADLDAYQDTITREVFETELIDVYSEGPAWKTSVKIADDHAMIRDDAEPYRLNFASSPSIEAPKRYWRPASEMPISEKDADDRPLEGIRIAIDPGHIGGDWAKMEERWYQINGEGLEVMEGEMTLRVAKLLKPQLEALGAEVTLVRKTNEPVTEKRPEDFLELAAEEMARDSPTPEQIKERSEKMFYRWSEIRARAEIINSTIKPDVTLCLHFNAESWGDPARPSLTTNNHLHFLINGTYSNGEFAMHDQRLNLMKRLLQRIHPEEMAVTSSVADSMATATGLPPYIYTRPTAKRVNDNPYVYARNLMANRIYYCPIVFVEPYVMNSEEVYQRIGAGDYEGLKEVAGQMRKSIFREYADSLTEGLVNYYRAARPRKS